MNNFELGQKLVDLCKQGENVQAIQDLYADDVVSIEADAMDPIPARMEGKAAVLKKTKWWLDNHKVHSADTRGPFPHGNRFAVFFAIDVTNKPSGQRMQVEEVGLYTVKDGKIVQEEFFYAPMS